MAAMVNLTRSGGPEGATERKLVQKIDFFILTFCCLSYFVNYVSMPPWILGAHLTFLSLIARTSTMHTYPA